MNLKNTYFLVLLWLISIRSSQGWSLWPRNVNEDQTPSSILESTLITDAPSGNWWNFKELIANHFADAVAKGSRLEDESEPLLDSPFLESTSVNDRSGYGRNLKNHTSKYENNAGNLSKEVSEDPFKNVTRSSNMSERIDSLRHGEFSYPNISLGSNRSSNSSRTNLFNETQLAYPNHTEYKVTENAFIKRYRLLNFNMTHGTVNKSSEKDKNSSLHIIYAGIHNFSETTNGDPVLVTRNNSETEEYNSTKHYFLEHVAHSRPLTKSHLNIVNGPAKEINHNSSESAFSRKLNSSEYDAERKDVPVFNSSWNSSKRYKFSRYLHINRSNTDVENETVVYNGTKHSFLERISSFRAINDTNSGGSNLSFLAFSISNNSIDLVYGNETDMKNKNLSADFRNITKSAASINPSQSSDSLQNQSRPENKTKKSVTNFGKNDKSGNSARNQDRNNTGFNRTSVAHKHAVDSLKNRTIIEDSSENAVSSILNSTNINNTIVNNHTSSTRQNNQTNEETVVGNTTVPKGVKKENESVIDSKDKSNTRTMRTFDMSIFSGKPLHPETVLKFLGQSSSPPHLLSSSKKEAILNDLSQLFDISEKKKEQFLQDNVYNVSGSLNTLTDHQKDLLIEHSPVVKKISSLPSLNKFIITKRDGFTSTPPSIVVSTETTTTAAPPPIVPPITSTIEISTTTVPPVTSTTETTTTTTTPVPPVTTTTEISTTTVPPVTTTTETTTPVPPVTTTEISTTTETKTTTTPVPPVTTTEISTTAVPPVTTTTVPPVSSTSETKTTSTTERTSSLRTTRITKKPYYPTYPPAPVYNPPIIYDTSKDLIGNNYHTQEEMDRYNELVHGGARGPAVFEVDQHTGASQQEQEHLYQQEEDTQNQRYGYSRELTLNQEEMNNNNFIQVLLPVDSYEEQR